MKELSLFSGAGGGLLASRLLGWQTIGYVEKVKYCQRVLRRRMDEGHIDRAPIFGDLRVFLGDGYAASYTGLVDVVSAGFPCQPFSGAGQRKGAADDRNMWPSTRDTVCLVRPRYAFLENVPGLISSKYFDTILRDLAEIGYDAEWCVLGAYQVGAPHKRDRLWVVATDARRDKGWHDPRREHGQDGASSPVPHDRRLGKSLANNDGHKRPCTGTGSRAPALGEAPHHAPEPSGTRMAETAHGRDLDRSNWWRIEPDVGRVAHGVAARVDRLRALGNGQVPAVAALAWRILTDRGSRR